MRSPSNVREWDSPWSHPWLLPVDRGWWNCSTGQWTRSGSPQCQWGRTERSKGLGKTMRPWRSLRTLIFPALLPLLLSAGHRGVNPKLRGNQKAFKSSGCQLSVKPIMFKGGSETRRKASSSVPSCMLSFPLPINCEERMRGRIALLFSLGPCTC